MLRVQELELEHRGGMMGKALTSQSAQLIACSRSQTGRSEGDARIHNLVLHSDRGIRAFGETVPQKGKGPLTRTARNYARMG